MAAAVLILASLPVVPQSEGAAKDSRNSGRGEFKGTNDCYVCHSGWTPPLKDPFVVVPIFPTQAKVGEPAPFVVRVANAWIAEVRNLSVHVTLLSDDVVFNVEGSSDAAAPQTVNLRGTLTHPAHRATFGGSEKARLKFLVPPDHRRFDGVLELHPLHPAPEVDSKSMDVEVRLLDGAGNRLKQWDTTSGDAPLRKISVGAGEMTGGNWTLDVSYASGAGNAPRVEWMFTGTSSVGARNAVQFEVPVGPASIARRGYTDVPFQLEAVRPGTVWVDVHIRAELYYQHHGCSGCYDSEYYHRFGGAEVAAGDQYLGPQAIVELPAVGGSDPRVVLGEVSGISSALLLPPSLVLGGTFGRASRRGFNAALGGAKRRVMFHNTVSLGLTLAAVVHVILFVLEPQYNVAVGILWGGLGTFCLLGLGLTGYYQVPLIQKHGYEWWRRIHLVLGVLVIVFVAGHSLLDGADFGALKDQMPEWLRMANLA